LQTTADAAGLYACSNVALALGPNAFSVRATDRAGNQQTTMSFPLNVTRVAAPVINDQAFSVAENSPNGSPVGMIAANDPDGGTPTFGVTGDTGQTAFAVNATTGEITVADRALLDFETTPNFALNVQVTGADNLTDTAVMTINLTDVTESVANTNPRIDIFFPPPDISRSPGHTIEIRVFDFDLPSQQLTTSVAPLSDGARLLVGRSQPSPSGSSQFSRFVTPTVPGTYTFEVTATDGVGGIATRSFTIHTVQVV
jgi:Cadherin domain